MSLLIAYHHGVLMLGCLLIALLWGVHGPVYAIPRPVFLLFGVVSPMIQMFFSILLFFTPFQTSIFLLCPISFSLLFAIGFSRERQRRQSSNCLWEDRLRQAEEALSSAPDNAPAHLSKAKLLDAAGLREDALRSYEEAHRISSKTFSDFELSQVERRLGPQARPRLEGGPRGGGFALGRLPGAGIRWVFCLLLAAPVLALDKRLFVGVLSVWLFALWYDAAHREHWSL